MKLKEITRKWLGVEWERPYRGHIVWMWIMSLIFAACIAVMLIGTLINIFR